MTIKWATILISLGVVFTGCEQSKDFKILEETKAFLDAETEAPLLTRVNGVLSYGVEETLRLNFNNEKFGSDEGMSYECFVDDNQNGQLDGARQSCTEMSIATKASFDSESGALLLGPFSNTGDYDLVVVGSNATGKDTSVVKLSIVQSKVPLLERILDQTIAADATLNLQAVNKRASDDAPTTYSCSFDQTLDEDVTSGSSCSELPGQPTIKFDATAGILSWQPPESAQGVYEFKIEAANAYGSDAVLFIVSVGESTEKKVSLTYIRDQYVFAGDTLSVDATNQLTSDDTGVTYSCYYDAVIDGIVGTSLTCDQLPGSPAQKFNTLTGVLEWTPDLNQQTEIEVLISGSKDGDTDEQIFLVSFSTQRFGEVGNSAITFSPNSWDFGSVALSSNSDAKSITITNGASSDIYIGGFSMSNAEFIVNWHSCPTPPSKFESEDTCVVNITYQPVTAAQLGAFLTVNFGKTSSSTSEYSSVLGLSGRGVGQLNFDGLQSISDVTHNSLKLNWNETPQAASFLIFKVIEVSSVPTLVYLETIVNTSGTVNSKTITNLQPNTAYTYRVRATDYVGVVDNNTADVTATTLVNRAPNISSGPSPWLVYSGRTISNVDFNDNYSGGDFDRDGDTISYTCRYDNTIDGVVDSSAALCSSLTNVDATNPTFNQYSGIFSGWKPTQADGENPNSYEFKIIAEDFYGASSTAIFSTTVQIGYPTLSTVNDMVFPNNAVTTQEIVSIDFDNERFSPYNDTDMTYACSFTRLSPDSPGAQNCTSLPGTLSFSTETGQLSWEPSATAAGSYEFTITGTNLVANDTETFVVAVVSPIGLDNRIHHLDARFADLSRSGQNNPSYTDTWSDLLAVEADADLYNFDQTGAWDGVGTPVDPVALIFDGVDDYVDVVSSVNAESYVRFEAWVYPGSNAREKVIFSYGNNTENGIILTSKRLWLGRGNQAYETAVLSDGPYVYYKMNNVTSGVATDSSGNTRNGLVANTSEASDDVDDATFDLTGSAALFQGSYIDPNITAGGGTSNSIDISNDWTIETWFYYPFPTGCVSGCYLTRSTGSGQDDRVVSVMSDQRLRVYLRNKGGWHWPTPTDAGQTYYYFSDLDQGWHHLAVVGTGTGASEQMDYYINGEKIASLNQRSTENIKYIGNLNTNARYSFGYIDEFAYYDKALTGTDILDHYNAGQKGSCDYFLKEGYWYHVAGYVDDTAKTLNLFLNGKQHCSVSIAGISTLAGSNENLTIGRSQLGAGTSWAGKLQSLSFYSSGADSEISSNYQASKDSFDALYPLPPSGLRLWLRADQGVYQDAAKSTAANSDEDPVTIWEDISGNGGDMIGDDDANDDDTPDTDYLPVVRTNVLNGQPVVEFDGIDDYIRNSTLYGEPNTVFLVARYSTKNATSSRGRVLAGASDNWLLGFHNNEIDQFYANGWVHDANVAGNEEWQIYAADHSGDDVQRLFKNNVTLQSTTSGVSGPRGLGLGGYRYNSQLSTCQVAEVIVFDRVLSSSERAAIFQYLNDRYNVY